MIEIDRFIDGDQFLVGPGKRISLKEFETEYNGSEVSKDDAGDLLKQSIKQLADIQEKLYADNRYSVLIIFQAMDAAGKDSSIKHVMSGFNPQGVKVHSFKAPTKHELDHTYLWRHYQALPARGEIAIFNRSYYENVLVTRVHPEYILGEQLPGIDTLDKIDQAFWDKRFEQINAFEKNLVENGTIILKFYLHLSKKEQKKRLLERIDKKEKNWKFSYADLRERDHWHAYQAAFEEVFSKTSLDNAPWHIVPADDKWYTRLAIASVIHKKFTSLDLAYPKLSEKQEQELVLAKKELLEE